jgi:hypothetical protein
MGSQYSDLLRAGRPEFDFWYRHQPRFFFSPWRPDVSGHQALSSAETRIAIKLFLFQVVFCWRFAYSFRLPSNGFSYKLHGRSSDRNREQIACIQARYFQLFYFSFVVKYEEFRFLIRFFQFSQFVLGTRQ